MPTQTASPGAPVADPPIDQSRDLSVPTRLLRITVRWHLPAVLRRTRIIPVSELVADEAFAAYLAASIRDIHSFYSRAHVSMTTVPLENVYPISRIAEKKRVRRANRLVRLMRRRGYALFVPCLLRYRGEANYHLVLPPVVERAGQGVVVVDGVHRLTVIAHSRRHEAPNEVVVVLVHGSGLPRPAAIPGTLERVQVTNYDPGRLRKFRRFKPELFRPAGSTLRSAIFQFKSVGHFIATCETYGRK
jgi:hypothetical protein